MAGFRCAHCNRIFLPYVCLNDAPVAIVLVAGSLSLHPMPAVSAFQIMTCMTLFQFGARHLQACFTGLPVPGFAFPQPLENPLNPLGLGYRFRP